MNGHLLSDQTARETGPAPEQRASFIDKGLIISAWRRHPGPIGEPEPDSRFDVNGDASRTHSSARTRAVTVPARRRLTDGRLEHLPGPSCRPHTGYVVDERHVHAVDALQQHYLPFSVQS